jgi:hypothetical protein
MIQNAPSNTEIMSYTYHEAEADWHEFVFHRSDNSTVDHLSVYLEELYQRPQTGKIRILFDTTKKGGLPLIYSYQMTRALILRYPNRPHMRYTFLSDNRLDLMKMVRSMVLALNPNVDANYFGAGQRSAALTWMLRD